jgi:hypothetical protein
MDKAAAERMLARAADPNLVAGIYNYCDRCCHRCAFTARCFNFLESTRDEERHNARSPAEVVRASLQRTMDLMQVVADKHGVVLRFDPDEENALVREEETRRLRGRADPLVASAERYPAMALPIVDALWPVVAARHDSALMAAVERIQELAISVASKIYRAVAGTFEPDYGSSEVQSDVNGSAKVALLMIHDSRRAWLELMTVGHGTGPDREVSERDGVRAAGVRCDRGPLAKIRGEVRWYRFARRVYFVNDIYVLHLRDEVDHGSTAGAARRRSRRGIACPGRLEIRRRTRTAGARGSAVGPRRGGGGDRRPHRIGRSAAGRRERAEEALPPADRLWPHASSLTPGFSSPCSAGVTRTTTGRQGRRASSRRRGKHVSRPCQKRFIC